jgi:hypothetical protein
MEIKTPDQLNIWTFVLFLGIIFLTSCTTAQANAPFSESIYDLDPIYRNIYYSMGGERILGKVISAPFKIGDRKAQFVEKALLVFDPKSNEANTIQLLAIGNQLGISENQLSRPKYLPEGWLYINGHIIPKEFAEVFLELGGIERVGNPLTEVHFNPIYRRYEQYFEKLGLYRLKSDPKEAVYCMGYGEWLCGEQCILGNDQNDQIDILPTQERLIQDFIVEVGAEFSGYVLEEKLENGNYQALLKNMMIAIEPGDPDQVKILPLSELVGYQADTPDEPINLPDMVFIPVDTQGRGFHIHKIIYEYIQAHGGLEISGEPISRMTTSGTIKRQCFTNMCFLIDPNAEYEQVYPETLGYTFQRVFYRNEASLDDKKGFEKSAKDSLLELPDGELRVWEKYPSLPQDQVQVINIEKSIKNGNTSQDLSGRLVLQPPGQGEILLKFNISSEDHVEITLPVIVVPNGTLITYEVCVFPDGKPYCLESEFVIWTSP